MSSVLKKETGRRINLQSGFPLLLEVDPTVLLLHCDGTNGSTVFPDSSPSGHTVTALGNAQVSTTTPKFGTGCATFDGTDDYLEITDNVANFRWGTEDFTVAFFVRFAEFKDNAYLLSTKSSSGTLFFNMYMSSGRLDLVISDYGGSKTYRDYTWFMPALNTWYHFQFGIKDGVDYFFVDGKRITAVAGSWGGVGFNCDQGLMIGTTTTGSSNFFNGQMDDITITKGRCLNTSDFTPPSTPLSDNYTKLLLHCNGTNGSTTFTDSSPINHIVTAHGNAQISTTNPKFGTGCVTFDGDGDYLDISNEVTDFRWNGDFTIEAFLKFASLSGTPHLFCTKSYYGYLWFDMYMLNSSTLRVRDYSTYKNYSWSPSLDTWYHIQFGVASGVDYFFVDGQRITGSGSGWDGLGFNCYEGLIIGAYYNGSANFFNGQMDEIRVSKNICRNTSDFTPPTGEYS